jgi:hypothetical protein
MSALAARRAAQTARSSSSSPAPARAAAAPRTAERATSISSASSRSAESEASDEESEAGPSTSSPPAQRTQKLRYYAAPAGLLEPGGLSSAAAPARKAKRKRAYSPGAPVDSDGGEDSSAAGDEGEEEMGMEDAPYGSTVTTPRPASTSAIQARRCVPDSCLLNRTTADSIAGKKAASLLRPISHLGVESTLSCYQCLLWRRRVWRTSRILGL